jgi:alpha-amylase/alpha-mannosidase (GH57 family)
MKKAIILVVVICLHLSTIAQLFDATIDGCLPGIEKDVVSHFQKKRYLIHKDTKHSDDLLFMFGEIKPFEDQKNRCDVLLQLEKEENSDFVHTIKLYFMSKTQKDYEAHKKRFIERFGEPASIYNKRAVWQIHFYKYTIGLGDDDIYHEIKLNKIIKQIAKEVIIEK